MIVLGEKCNICWAKRRRWFDTLLKLFSIHFSAIPLVFLLLISVIQMVEYQILRTGFYLRYFRKGTADYPDYQSSCFPACGVSSSSAAAKRTTVLIDSGWGSFNKNRLHHFLRSEIIKQERETSHTQALVVTSLLHASLLSQEKRVRPDSHSWPGSTGGTATSTAVPPPTMTHMLYSKVMWLGGEVR